MKFNKKKLLYFCIEYLPQKIDPRHSNVWAGVVVECRQLQHELLHREAVGAGGRKGAKSARLAWREREGMGIFLATQELCAWNERRKLVKRHELVRDE